MLLFFAILCLALFSFGMGWRYGALTERDMWLDSLEQEIEENAL